MFAQVEHDSTVQTATIGADLIWDDFYAALGLRGVNVVGGRVSGKCSADNSLLIVVQGIVTKFTLKTFPQTRVWVHTYPDTCPDVLTQDAKGGVITYTVNVLDRVNLATADFSADNTGPKASIVTMYNCVLGEARRSCSVFFGNPIR
ncbi:hypothetical protein J3R83DRAFT_5473 [Lanmaoa asiatica]|nr:hypothetical protein J3R83DRAFT_5473 [Lanmaoa asiatica]